MSETNQDRFYNLLPDLYRWRDQSQGESLRTFLAVIERELLTVEADMAAQHNNWFIQTCDPWAIAYIADLLGVRHVADQVQQLPFNQRRLVANTLAYRRRKGTLVILEQVAWDVTHWHVHAVEFQQLLAATQHLQHLRLDKGKTADLRQPALVSDADGPFTTLAHSADVRRAALPQTSAAQEQASAEQASAAHHRLGKYNRNNIGLFFWRLQSYPVKKSYANTVANAEAHPGCFRFSRNGDIPLFHDPQSFASITQMATAVNMPIRLTRAALAADLDDYTKSSGGEQSTSSKYYGPERGLSILRNGKPIPPSKVVSMNLEHWPKLSKFTNWDVQKEVAIDVELGRIVFYDPYLFRIDLDFVRELDNDSVSPYLRQKFEEADEHLSNKAIIKKVKPVGDKWIIFQTKYRIERKAQALEVYRDPSPKPSQPEQPLFRIDLDFVRELDNDSVSSHLRQKFEEAGEHLSNEAAINKIEPAGGKWIIIQTKYRIERKGRTLNVYCDARTERQRRNVVTDYTYGFSAEIGGGSYSRNLQVDEARGNYFEIQVAIGGINGESWEGKSLLMSFTNDVIAEDLAIVDSLDLALACWNAYCTNSQHKGKGYIRILDNGVYDIASITLPAGANLTIIADDGVQPTIKVNALEESQAIQIQLGKESSATQNATESVFEHRLRLNGIRVERPIEIGKIDSSTGNRLDFKIEHCTLMHADVSLRAPAQASNLGLTVQIDHSIVGPLCLSSTAELSITDSIVDCKGRSDAVQNNHSQVSAIAGSQLSIDRSTIFGLVKVDKLNRASEVIFDGTVNAKETVSPVQYSYFPDGSNITWPENCPSQELQPVFTSRRYGQPGYAQLSLDCPPKIRRGAENGSEIGVFHHLSQPQREDNIGSMLDEYLPYGFEVGVFYVT